jgi:ribosomal protein L6P/L9E
MSRIGRKPIVVPSGVEVKIADGTVSIKGKNGELKLTPHSAMKIAFDAGSRHLTVARPDDQRQNRALHGLTRSLLNNMVAGVQTYFEKRLEVQGVGYTATVAGKTLNLQVGYANTVKMPIPTSSPRVLTSSWSGSSRRKFAPCGRPSRTKARESATRTKSSSGRRARPSPAAAPVSP